MVICAEHWLVDNTKIFNNGEQIVNNKNTVVGTGYAYVGLGVCDPAVPSACDFMSPFVSEDCALKHYCRQSARVPIGETSGGDNPATIIFDGGSRSARWIQKELGLAPISALAVAPFKSGS